MTKKTAFYEKFKWFKLVICLFELETVFFYSDFFKRQNKAFAILLAFALIIIDLKMVLKKLLGLVNLIKAYVCNLSNNGTKF